MHNKTLETNCRPASPLDAWWQFGRTVDAQPCVSSGSRSALRSAGAGVESAVAVDFRNQMTDGLLKQQC